MSEKEALYIFKKSYPMSTDHELDQENIKLKKAIKKIIQINKYKNVKLKKIEKENEKLKKENFDLKEQIIFLSCTYGLMKDNKDDSVSFDTLYDWYINSINDTVEPIWTKKHIEELLNDFILYWKEE